MQEKKPVPYLEMLQKRKEANDARAKKKALAFSFAIVAYFAYTETSDTDHSRLVSRFFTLMLFALLYRAYETMTRGPRRALTFYKGEMLLREYAQSNNIEGLKVGLKALGLQRVNACGQDSGKSLLHFAVQGDAKEAIVFLLKLQADINIQDKQGNTPLHLALLKMLKNKSLDFTILNTLLKAHEPASTPNMPVAGLSDSTFNIKIDATLPNENGQTIKDLLAEVKKIIEEKKQTDHTELRDGLDDMTGDEITAAKQTIESSYQESLEQLQKIDTVVNILFETHVAMRQP